MAHLCGLASPGEGKVNEQWWNVENLEKVSSHLMLLAIITVNSWREPPKNAAVANSL
jgi:hypothetical protein